LQIGFVGEFPGVGGEGDDAVFVHGFNAVEDLGHDFGDFVGAPFDPGGVFGIRWGLLAVMFAGVEVAGVGVVAEVNGEAEVVVELDAVDVVVGDEFGDEGGDVDLDLGVEGAEPVAFDAAAFEPGGGAVAALADPVGVALGDAAVVGEHEAEFEPGDDLQVLAVAFGDGFLEDVAVFEAGVGVLGGAADGFLDGAGIEGVAVVEDCGVGGVEVEAVEAAEGCAEVGFGE